MLERSSPTPHAAAIDALVERGEREGGVAIKRLLTDGLGVQPLCLRMLPCPERSVAAVLGRRRLGTLLIRDAARGCEPQAPSQPSSYRTSS